MARNEGNTDKAYDDGAFGLPWFTCTNSAGKTEGFWGVDYLGQVTSFLGLLR
jgi:2-hydroxychromene-2-carboxylate isomerase